MNQQQFDNVSVLTHANITHEGRCIKHIVLFKDGKQKMLCVLLPCNEEYPEYRFQMKAAQKIEIMSGECQIRLEGTDDFETFRVSQNCYVQGGQRFVMKTNEVVNYICHLEE